MRLVAISMKHPTPASLITILKAIEEQTAKLSAAAALLEVTRHFTLDGRLVGDIGEMLAAQHLEITLDQTQRRGHDGFTQVASIQREVQVKCRKAATLISFTSVPDLLVIIAFAEDWSSWEIVYNGEGTPIRRKAEADGYEVDAEGRIKKGGRKASLDLFVKWFREPDHNPYRACFVPARPQPLPIFKES